MTGAWVSIEFSDFAGKESVSSWDKCAGDEKTGGLVE
jgi:hypothetical protein